MRGDRTAGGPQKTHSSHLTSDGHKRDMIAAFWYKVPIPFCHCCGSNSGGIVLRIVRQVLVQHAGSALPGQKEQTQILRSSTEHLTSVIYIIPSSPPRLVLAAAELAANIGAIQDQRHFHWTLTAYLGLPKPTSLVQRGHEELGWTSHGRIVRLSSLLCPHLRPHTI
jgi:hypothetical protein